MRPTMHARALPEKTLSDSSERNVQSVSHYMLPNPGGSVHRKYLFVVFDYANGSGQFDLMTCFKRSCVWNARMEDPRSKASDWTGRNSLLCNEMLRLCGETSCDKVISADLCSHAGICRRGVLSGSLSLFIHVVLRFLRSLSTNSETADYRSSSARWLDSWKQSLNKVFSKIIPTAFSLLVLDVFFICSLHGCLWIVMRCPFTVSGSMLTPLR